MPLQYAANATVDISVQAVEISLNMSPSSADTTVHIVSEQESVTLPVYASDSTPITTGDLSVITTLEFEDTDHVIQPALDAYKTVIIDPLPARENEFFTLDLLPVQLVPFIFEVQTDNLVYHDYDYYRYESGNYIQYTTDPNHASLSIEGSGGKRLTEVTWLPSATPSPGAAVISSPADSYTLPTVDGGVYNCTVEWGDGTTSTITSWNQAEVTHQYPSSGKYRIKISGKFEGINFHRHEELNHHDHLKLLDVISWGDDSKMDIAGYVAPFNPHNIPSSGSNGIHTAYIGMFCGCKYWNDVSGGAPNWGTCGTANTLHPSADGRRFGSSSMITTFYGNSSLQADISVWTTEDKPFTGAAYRLFRSRPRSSEVDTFKANFHWIPSNGNSWEMFSGASEKAVGPDGSSLILSNRNQIFEISNWKPTTASPFSASTRYLFQNAFENSVSMNPDVSDLVNSNCTSVRNLFNGVGVFTGRGLENWSVSDMSNLIELNESFKGTSINKILPWTFALGANISGMLQNCDLYNSPCNGWDTSGVLKVNSLFSGSGIFNNGGVSWTDADWTNCEDFIRMFKQTSFNQDISRWKLPTTKDFNMLGMFRASPFNRPVNTTMVNGTKYWDMSRCTNTAFMFADCPFDQPLDAWDVSNVTNMGYMFYNNNDFNKPLDSWDVSNVTNMKAMFTNASSFNQPLIAWDVSSVTTMNEMFYETGSFDQDLSGWDVSNVTTMTNMFLNSAFTGQGLSTWSPSSALESLKQTFYGTPLPSDIDLGSWDVSGVKNFDRCFYKTDITGVNLDNWDVSSAEILSGMFNIANNFNTDISGWDVSKAKDLRSVFKSATSFNQDLSSWNLSSLVQNIDVYEIPYGDDSSLSYDYQGFRTLADGSTGLYSGMFGIFTNSGMSKANLDLTISGWCDSSNTPNGSTLTGGELQLDVIPLDNSSSSQRLDSSTINKMKDKNMTAKYTDGNFVY